MVVELSYVIITSEPRNNQWNRNKIKAYWYYICLEDVQSVLSVCSRFGADEKLFVDDYGRDPVSMVSIERCNVKGDIERLMNGHRKNAGEKT